MYTYFLIFSLILKFFSSIQISWWGILLIFLWGMIEYMGELNNE